MNLQKTNKILFLAALALALAACGPGGGATAQPQSTPSSPPAGGASLEGTRWSLVSLGRPGEETPVVEGSNVTLAFEEDGQAGGSAGCNSYGGQYQVEGDNIAFREIVSTLMACADEQVNAQETRYLQALGAAGRFTVTEDRLTILYENDQNALNFEPLPAASTPAAQAPVITDANLMPSGPDQKQYTLAAEAGQTITVEITSDGAPLSLEITSPGGDQRLPELAQVDGGYTIKHTFSAGETGEFQLTLTKADRTPSTNYTVTVTVQ